MGRVLCILYVHIYTAFHKRAYFAPKIVGCRPEIEVVVGSQTEHGTPKLPCDGIFGG